MKRAAPSLHPDGGGERVQQAALEMQLSGEGLHLRGAAGRGGRLPRRGAGPGGGGGEGARVPPRLALAPPSAP